MSRRKSGLAVLALSWVAVTPALATPPESAVPWHTDCVEYVGLRDGQTVTGADEIQSAVADPSPEDVEVWRWGLIAPMHPELRDLIIVRYAPSPCPARKGM
jgi:hypothetical protein